MKKGNWTIIFEDKKIIKNNGAESGTGYYVNDEPFWSDSKFSNIWAIQYTGDDDRNQVEYRDKTSNSTYDSSALGDIQQFIDKWDAEHLNFLKEEWDSDNIADEEGNFETEADKTARLGPRPTSYSS